MPKEKSVIVYPPTPMAGNLSDLQSLIWHELVDLRTGRVTVTHAASVAALARQFIQFIQTDRPAHILEHRADD